MRGAEEDGRVLAEVVRRSRATGEPSVEEGEDVGDLQAVEMIEVGVGCAGEPGVEEGEDVGDLDGAVVVVVGTAGAGGVGGGDVEPVLVVVAAGGGGVEVVAHADAVVAGLE